MILLVLKPCFANSFSNTDLALSLKQNDQMVFLILN